MPRLTNDTFLAAHYYVRQLWLDDVGHFAGVSERDQIELHLFLLPSKDWPDAELIQHRQTVSRADPSLPQRAGRALKRFERVLAGELEYVPDLYVSEPAGRQRVRAISVRAVMRPEPDVKRFARAIIEMAKEQAEWDNDKVA